VNNQSGVNWSNHGGIARRRLTVSPKVHCINFGYFN